MPTTSVPTLDPVALVTRAFTTPDDAAAEADFAELGRHRSAVLQILDDAVVLDALRDASPRRNTAFWSTVAQTLDGGGPAPADDFLGGAASDERRFGQWFAELADAVPASPSGGPSGQHRLTSLLTTIPRVREEDLAVLRATDSARGALDVSASFGTALVERGVTPLLFLHAGRAVGHLLRLAVRAGTLAADASVHLSPEGLLGDGWGGYPGAAVQAVVEAVEVDDARAAVLVRWVVAASEVSPFLFLRRRADIVPSPPEGSGGVLLCPLTPEEVQSGVDAPAAAWTLYRTPVPVDAAPAHA